MEVITQTTAVSIGLIATVVGLVGAFIGWITRIYTIASQNQSKITELEKDVSAAQEELKKNNEFHGQHSERLSAIEATLKSVAKQQDTVVTLLTNTLQEFIKKS